MAAHENIRRRIAWTEDWALPYEGSYTLISKFAWGNSLTTKEVCERLFGCKPAPTHSGSNRSLIYLDWCMDYDPQYELPQSLKIKDATIAAKSGRWAPALATDSAIRYCKSCMRHGYHSYLFQIEALELCPLHREKLISKCLACGFGLWPYAICDDTFDAPFHCSNCGKALAGEFVMQYLFNNSDFAEQLARAMQPLDEWLERLNSSNYSWPIYAGRKGGCYFFLKCRSTIEPHVSATSVACQVARELVPAQVSGNLFNSPGWPTRYLSLEPRDLVTAAMKPAFSANPKFPISVLDKECGGKLLPACVLAEQLFKWARAIYKSIKRNLERRVLGKHRRCLQRTRRVVQGHLFNDSLAPRADECHVAQALVLWQFKCENRSWIPTNKFEFNEFVKHQNGSWNLRESLLRNLQTKHGLNGWAWKVLDAFYVCCAIASTLSAMNNIEDQLSRWVDLEKRWRLWHLYSQPFSELTLLSVHNEFHGNKLVKKYLVTNESVATALVQASDTKWNSCCRVNLKHGTRCRGGK